MDQRWEIYELHINGTEELGHMTRIGIIVGSTRPGRRGEEVANWVLKVASERKSATYEIIDLADFELPILDEPIAAAMGQNYQNAHTNEWSAAIQSFDGYVIVTPEYNHGPTGALKNAIDYLYHEWRDKAVGFVGYGLLGATRAVEQLRLITAELYLAGVRDQVALSLFTDFDSDGNLNPGDHHEPTLTKLLEQVEAWTNALAPLRTSAK
ncbi:NAD(P)H-dependent oxidoreductase [Rhodococcus sp. IEGM 1330]|uniref:NADPH-dependent FMN reductase n=1 Tax=Rhodococcus sp. IEGM 1330 TaxID=3082225 RepID=UPI002954B838|nr:NAD(P)H-dependent oxidoreductase [Rhodococcus sp. IEGM 1330]MDV8025330.1 NAD(P)H-dependent oxidoreductase [Rhodococcus sp. IEGM 1330]